MTYAAITGWGKCMPPAVLNNADLATFLETDDEHFAYAPWADIPPQGRWAISGAALPPAHLEAIYRGTALRLGL